MYTKIIVNYEKILEHKIFHKNLRNKIFFFNYEHDILTHNLQPLFADDPSFDDVTGVYIRGS